jgi:hypothetical protein
MSDLKQHKFDCDCTMFWCSKGIAECHKCKRKFYEKGGKELKYNTPLKSYPLYKNPKLYKKKKVI